MSDDVAGVCPACGSRSLFLASGGHVTCRIVDCPNPSAVDELLTDTEIEHVVKFEPDGFTIRHPLIERIDNGLMRCELHAYCEALTGPPVQPGVYRAYGPRAGWHFEVISQP